MEPPFFSVRKGSSIINVAPPAIRFWEKTGLHPLGKQKNVNAFILYESENVEMSEHASQWFKKVSVAYTVRLCSKHRPHQVNHVMVVKKSWIP